jgi:urea transport system permease protein
VNYAKTAFTTGVLAPYWLFVLGGLFIFVTVVLPKGILGTFADWLHQMKRRGDGKRGGDDALTVRPEQQAAE